MKIIIPILTALLIYGLFAVSLWELNPRFWPSIPRAFMSFGISIVLFIGMIINIPKDHNSNN